MKATRAEIYACRTRAQLKELGAKYGWKFGAAEKIHEARQRPKRAGKITGHKN